MLRCSMRAPKTAPNPLRENLLTLLAVVAVSGTVAYVLRWHVLAPGRFDLPLASSHKPATATLSNSNWLAHPYNAISRMGCFGPATHWMRW